MKELRTEIEIHATPEKVWRVISELDKYPEWNPFIHHAIGKTKIGEKVDITFKTGSKEMILHCVVIKSEPNRELRWKYHVGLNALFSADNSLLHASIRIDSDGKGAVVRSVKSYCLWRFSGSEPGKKFP